MAGLTISGLIIKTLDDIKTELEQAWQTIFGASVNVNPQSANGQIIGAVADRLNDLWELAQSLYSAFDPDAAQGQALDTLCALTGTVRVGSKQSVGTLNATGTVATVIPQGRVVSVAGTGVRFATDAPATIVAAPAWTNTTGYNAGSSRVTNSTRMYQCITTGVSAGAGGPTTTAADIVDGTVHWRYMGEGAGIIDIPCTAEDTGPLAAVSGTLTVIETPVAGWLSANNMLDATLGSDMESDASLRIRREFELEGNAQATVNAIRARVLKVDETTTDPVTACIVFQNTTLVPDVNGLPGKSVEVLALGGDDEHIRQQVFDSTAAGIETYGSNSGNITDSAGNVHVVKFSRPTSVNIYVTFDITVLQSSFTEIGGVPTFPADGVAQIQAAVVALGDGYPIGKNVTAWAMGAVLDQIPGILDVTSIKIGTAPAPGASVTIDVTSRQLPLFDTSRIVVNVTPGSL